MTREFNFGLGAELSPSIMALTARLPLKPADVNLSGAHVKLVPLDLGRHLDALYSHSNGSAIVLGERTCAPYDPELVIWRYMSEGPFATKSELAAHLLKQIEASNGLCLCVIDLLSAQPIGVCNYMNNFPAHLKVELGSIWYSPVVQRTKANLEATFLMLEHAFTLGYRRVEWKCDALNERSRRAALRMGFKFEGVQEKHFIVKGRNRDTAWFRMLNDEWPDARTLLQDLLARP